MSLGTQLRVCGVGGGGTVAWEHACLAHPPPPLPRPHPGSSGRHHAGLGSE